MEIDLPRIDRKLRETICPTCYRFTSERTCSLPKDRSCSLFGNLEGVVDDVRSTHSPRIDPYVDVLREQVCARCHFEDDHGSCPCREDLDCALNVYFPLIVDTIEIELAAQSRANAKARAHRTPPHGD